LLALGTIGFFTALYALPAAGAPAVAQMTEAPSGWSPLAPFDFGGSGQQHELESVSCPSTTLCVGVDSNGDAVTSTDPTAVTPTWSVNHVYDGYSLYGISCPSTSLCVAVGGQPGYVSITTDPADGASATWTNTDVDGHASMYQVSCPSASLCFAIDAADVLTTADPSDPSPTWTVNNVEKPSDPNAGTLAGISCPTATFCAAVDESGRVLTSADPDAGASANWVPINVVPSSDGFSSISCPSAGLCVALDRQGDAVTSTNPTLYDAAIWTFANIDTDDNHLGSITCASATLCLAGDAVGNVLATSDPTEGSAAKWTLANADPANRVYGIGSPNAIASISCPTSSFCVAVDLNGHAVTSTSPTGGASAWTVAQADSDVDFQSNAPTAVSCASNSFCAAVDGRGNILATTDPADGAAATWTPSPQVVPRDVYRAISCPSTSLCVAADWGGSISASTDPTAATPTWSVTDRVNAGDGFRAVSCPSSSLCVAASELGTITTSTDPADPTSWTHRDVDGNTDIYGVSCPSNMFCVAVDSHGAVLTSTDPSDGPGATWTVTADSIPDVNEFVAVSCPSTSFCAAVDGENHVVTSIDPLGDASAWTSVAIGSSVEPTPYLDAISCASASVCVVTGTTYGQLSGERFTSADPTGGPSAWVGGAVDANDDLDGVSCPSNGMCLVVGLQGYFSRAIAPQSATTDGAESVTDTTAKLNGTIDPNGWDVDGCHFDYGTSADALDSTVPCLVSLPILGASSAVAVSADVNRLTPATSYYFKLVTASPAGTSSGLVQQFTSRASTTTTTTTTTTSPAAPSLSDARIVPKAFRAARGTRVSYYDTETAATRFTVQYEVSGVERAGRCETPARPSAKRKRKRCERWVGVGGFSHRDIAGANRFHFNGRVKGRKLVPGRYRLRAVADLDGLTSNRLQVGFRVRKS